MQSPAICSCAFCVAIAFLKAVTKLDGILHSLGIGISRSPGSMLSEVLLAFRGFEIG